MNRSRTPPLAVGAGVAVLVLLSGNPPAEASCGTAYCRHQTRLWDRSQEEKAIREIEADPSNHDAWKKLLSHLGRKAERERWIAAYRSRFDWESQPALVDPTFEDRLRKEQLSWLALYRERFGHEGEALCRWSRYHPDLPDRIRVLQEAHRERGDDPALVRCLARALVNDHRQEDAVALVQRFREEHEDVPEAHRVAIDVLRSVGRERAARSALEGAVDRFPSERGLRLDLLGRYADEGMRREAEELVSELLATAEGPEEIHDVCWRLDSAEAKRRCAEEVVRTARSRGLEDDLYMRSAPADLLQHAVREGNRREVDRLLADWPEQRLIRAWGAVLAADREKRRCPELIGLYRNDAFRPALSSSMLPARNAVVLAGLLRSCGAEEQAEALLQEALPKDALFALPRGHEPVVLAELFRRQETEPETVKSLVTIHRQVTLLEPRARIPELERLAALLPEEPRPAVLLAKVHEELDGIDRALTWWEEAARRSGDLDHTLRRAVLAFEDGRTVLAASVARRALEREGTPRQHAEARYVLGRIARREGRWDEASGHLTHYFLLRLRFDGCRNMSTCDLGLIFHLREAHDLPRLREYMERRREAIGAFDETQRPFRDPTGDGHFARHDAVMHRGLQNTLTCVYPEVREYLTLRVQEDPDDRDLRVRLASARRADTCDRNLERTEERFRDERLLALYDELTEVR